MSGTIHPVTMPKFGLSMTEGMVAAWHVEEGGELRPGMEIADIETTKITNAYETPVGGVLRRKVAAAGATLPVGALIAVVADAGVPDAEVDAFVQRFQEQFAQAGPDVAASAPEPRRIEAGGTVVQHLAQGSGAGLPVLFVHGFGGDLNSWMFNMEALASEREVHAVDLPGHGGSAKRVSDGRVSALAEVVAAVADAAGLDRFHLAGHSLGGAVALSLASARPGRIASVSLVSPVGLGGEIDGTYVAGFIAADRRKELSGLLERLFAPGTPVGRDMVETVLRFKRLDGVGEALTAVAAANFEGSRQAVDLRGALERLDAPVQVLWGEEDRIIPVRHAEGLPGHVEAHRIPGAGHMAHLEKPADVNRLLAEFMRRSEA